MLDCMVGQMKEDYILSMKKSVGRWQLFSLCLYGSLDFSVFYLIFYFIMVGQMP